MDHNGELTAAEEIKRLKKENESLKDDLFALLQEKNQVSEATIRSEYQDICGSIETWIDYITADVEKSDFRKRYKEVVRSNKSRRMLRDLGLDPEKLGDYDNADYIVLSLVTELQLRYIFSRPYPVGVTKQQATVIDKIKEGMSDGSLDKEQLSIDKWRSEALTALTTSREFKNRQLSELQRIVHGAKKAISPWVLDRKAFAKHEQTLQREILGPALKLHQVMRTSIRRYDMRRPDVRVEPDSAQNLGESWIMKDIGTWGTVKKSEKIASPIYCLHPSIVRLDVGDGVRVLVKPVVLVALVEPSLSKGPITAEPGSIDVDSQKTANLRRADTVPLRFENRNNGSPRRAGTDRTPPRTWKTDDPRRPHHSHDVEWESERRHERNDSFKVGTTGHNAEAHRERRRSEPSLSFFTSMMGKVTGRQIKSG